MSEVLQSHLDQTVATMHALRAHIPTIERWGSEMAAALGRGQRLLAAGNGGSAAQAQHLTSELVGRYRRERRPLSAIALHAETSSVTAVANDYGWDTVFARQVEAHGRPGDIFVGLSTSGRSPNVVTAAACARANGLRCLALTGPAPNDLLEGSEDGIPVDAPMTAAIQEAHLVVVHLLCEAVDESLAQSAP